VRRRRGLQGRPGRVRGCRDSAARAITTTNSFPLMPSGHSLNPSAMNKYGRMAMQHWERTDPDRFRQIPASDREEFFASLGARAESEIQQLQDQLAGPDPPGESYIEKVGRLNMARLQAEEKVLAELILIPSPSSTEEEGNEAARWHLQTMQDRARLRQEDE
jgi:hypothetical protein